MSKNIPSFNIQNKCYCWFGHTLPFETTISIGIKGKIELVKLKKSIKEVIEETPVLNTRIIYVFLFLKRYFKKNKKHFDVNEIITVISKPLKNADGINDYADKQIIDFINSPINIEKDIPIKFLIIEKNRDEIVLYVKMHHSVADGHGMYLLVSKIFQKYNDNIDKPNIVNIPDEDVLCSLKKIQKLLPSNYDKARDKKRSLNKASFIRDNNNKNGQIKSIAFTLSKSEATSLSSFRKKANVTINDILVTAAALALNKIIKEKGKVRDVIRIGQSVNLRKHLDIKGGITNFTSAIDILLKQDDFKRIGNTLLVVKKEMTDLLDNKDDIYSAIKNLGLSYLPSKIVTKMYKINENKVIAKQPIYTTYMSNLGKLDDLLEKPDNCKFTFTWILTPPHFSYGIQFLVTTVGDVITINLVHLDPVITETTAKKILDYVQSYFKEICKINIKDFKN